MRVEVQVRCNIDLDYPVHSVRSPSAHGRDDIFGPVVDDQLGARCLREMCLFVRADGRADGRPAPGRKLNGGVSDGPRSAVYQNPCALWQVAVGEEASMCRHRRDTQACTELQRRSVGQSYSLPGRQSDPLSRRTLGSAPLSLVEPYPLANATRIDPLADGIDESRAILIRYN